MLLLSGGRNGDRCGHRSRFGQILPLMVRVSSSAAVIASYDDDGGGGMAYSLKLLLMMKKNHLYNTPLNLAHTIDLPSNLLRRNSPIAPHPPSPPAQPPSLPINHHTQIISSRKQPEGKGESVVLIEERSRERRNVLYKRLSDIKGQNKELEKYSYSKLLSKMVVSDPHEQYRTSHADQDNLRTISEYSCLRGKLLSMEEVDDERGETRSRGNSAYSNYCSRTTRIFKRYYMPSGEKGKTASPFFNPPAEQKYIYINGKKTECKRIHNFYTSQNFRNSYDRAFGKTKDSFYSAANRYDRPEL